MAVTFVRCDILRSYMSMSVLCDILFFDEQPNVSWFLSSTRRWERLCVSSSGSFSQIVFYDSKEGRGGPFDLTQNSAQADAGPDTFISWKMGVMVNVGHEVIVAVKRVTLSQRGVSSN